MNSATWRTTWQACAVATSCFLPSCEESFDEAAGGGGGGASITSSATSETTTSATGFGADFFDEGETAEVMVPESGRAYVDLDAGAPTNESGGWDLAFEGLDVFTHGGITADGMGAAFGPYAAAQFLVDARPEVPFLVEDHAAGAFIDWYAYDGTTHALFSRYHVVGVRRGEARYKVQILGYYGEVDGAPVSAVYALRAAEVGDVVGPTFEIRGIDGTAGGPSPDDGEPSGCVNLGTREVSMLTVAEAASSTTWDLCFRRDVVSVNGERGGPGTVEAIDLDAAETAAESLDDVARRTAASEEGRFDAVGPGSLDDPALAWHGDRVVSAFSDAWLQPGASPVAPAASTWLVVGDAGTEHLVAFESFAGATDTHPGTVKVRFKPLRD